MPDPKVVFSEQALAEVRSLIGKPLRLGQQFNELASADAICHFAYGYGDTNPLWNDVAYARKTRWGAVIAPPTFLSSCIGSMSPSVGFPGAHALWAEDEWTWRRPVREGDRIYTELYFQDCQRIHQQFADPMYAQVAKFVFQNQNKDLVAEEFRRTFRFVRHMETKQEGEGQAERDRYGSLAPWKYTDEEIERIYAEYDKEVVRGAAPRYFEDVQVGEAMPHVVKGPLTLTDIIAWKIGSGFPPFVRAHKMRVEYERRHPTTAVKNEYGIPDIPERVHWETELSRVNGIPVPFDYGHQRVSWLAQVATNWMGDDGFLRGLKVRLRRPNVLTDTCWCRGKVVSKKVDGKDGLVQCDLWAENQRKWITATAQATIVLPRRSA